MFHTVLGLMAHTFVFGKKRGKNNKDDDIMEEVCYITTEEIDADTIIKTGGDYEDGESSTESPSVHHTTSAMIAISQHHVVCSGLDVPEDPDHPIILDEDGVDDYDLGAHDKENDTLCRHRPATLSKSVKRERHVDSKNENHQQTRGGSRTTADEMAGTSGNYRDHFTSLTGNVITRLRDKDRPTAVDAGSVSSIDSVFLVDANLLHQSGLFEGTKKGYWVSSETVIPRRSWDGIDASEDGVGRSNVTSMRGWCHGQILLHATLPTAQQGWVNLLPTEIPSGPPLTESVHSWREYANARNLAPTSLAPLLLTNVMTVYHMLFNILHLPDKVPANAETGRHSGYLVYVLGAERELNHLPIFEELVYLIRGMDLELRFVSPAVKHLMDKARRHFPSSHLIISGDYVLDRDGGLDGSRLRISFEPDDALFHDTSVAAASSFALRADAVVGLNAGFGDGGTDWEKTILDLLWSRTPFCFSDGTKHDLRMVKDILIPQMMELHFKQRLVSGGIGPTPRCPDVELSRNPFHGAIAQASGDCRIPTMLNGHIISYKGERW